MIFIVFIAVVLIGLLTAAISNSSFMESANTDKETIALRISQAQQFSQSVARAVTLILDKGYSESDIRFAHADAPADYGDLAADADPTNQVFHRDGGGADYQKPPKDVSTATAWEFYGGTAIPGVGSDRADLVAVLPHVSKAFCAQLNALDQTNGEQDIPTDDGGSFGSAGAAGDCVYMGDDSRFGDGSRFYDPPNTMNDSSFTQYDTPSGSAVRPAPEGCVACSAGGTTYHFYHVILAR